MSPFSERVAAGLKRRGMTLRELCRAVALDPSFFSKVLAGKRSPPAEEDVLRRVAAALDLDAAELIVSAGRIPSEWRAVWSDADLFSRVHRLASGGAPAVAVSAPSPDRGLGRTALEPRPSPRARPRLEPARLPAHKPQSLSEELL